MRLPLCAGALRPLRWDTFEFGGRPDAPCCPALSVSVKLWQHRTLIVCVLVEIARRKVCRSNPLPVLQDVGGTLMPFS
ncbi:hypothetical protein FOMPIDRAFT_1025904, partial [Fomitopsis schrenkii]